MGRGVSWRVIRAAVAGTSHLRDELPCQDCCAVASPTLSNGDPVLAIIVADGAGSARLAELGAQLACEIGQQCIAQWVETTLEPWPTPQRLIEWFDAVRSALEQLALSQGSPLRDYACTLLLAVVTPEAAGYGQIGDGGIVIDEGNGLELVFWPEAGEYANMTCFITDEDALERVRVLVRHTGPDELALFTDGIQRLALDFKSGAVHAPFFEPMLAVLRQRASEECAALETQLTAFLDSPKVNSRTDDDKTLVLASRRVAVPGDCTTSHL
jgi:hypothetical protein